jgi:hypothetical protein
MLWGFFTLGFPRDAWNCMCRIRTINGYKLQKKCIFEFLRTPNAGTFDPAIERPGYLTKGILRASAVALTLE